MKTVSRLANKKYNRIFTFGCSFSQYFWATWPEIVSTDLGIPLYNFAECGAGNQYIANTVAQAHRVYNLDHNDLVMICWTGTLREDRWVGCWRLTGDVTTSTEYDDAFIAKHVDPLGSLIRDLASLSLVKELLSSVCCDYHMFSMIDISKPEMECQIINVSNVDIHQKLLEIYHEDVAALKPSFENVLWQDDIAQYKHAEMNEKWQNRFSDWHPQPREHLKYLSSIFDSHKFSKSTIQLVNECQNKLDSYIKDQLEHNDSFAFSTNQGVAEDLHITKNYVDRSKMIIL